MSILPQRNVLLRFQGRYGKGKGQEYLEKFMVEYRRGDDNAEWRIYADRKGKQVNEYAFVLRI